MIRLKEAVAIVFSVYLLYWLNFYWKYSDALFTVLPLLNVGKNAMAEN